jgi:hypothetical protein
MASLDFLLADLVTANRMLSREGVVDGLGHISVRGLFREMKKAGKLPQQWPFQLNLPTPADVLPMIERPTKAAAEKA